MAISDLRDAGSIKRAREQAKLETIRFQLSNFPLTFLVKHSINLNVATNTPMKQADLKMFFTRFFKTFIGLNLILKVSLTYSFASAFRLNISTGIQ